MHGQAGRDRGLERIVAMLAAFATLAERAALRSFPVRWIVLLLLRRAEAIARFYVEEVTDCDWPSPDDCSDTRYGSADALILAAFFRAMAAALATLLPIDRPGRARRSDAECGLFAPGTVLLVVFAAGRAGAPYDTS